MLPAAVVVDIAYNIDSIVGIAVDRRLHCRRADATRHSCSIVVQLQYSLPVAAAVDVVAVAAASLVAEVLGAAERSSHRTFYPHEYLSLSTLTFSNLPFKYIFVLDTAFTALFRLPKKKIKKGMSSILQLWYKIYNYCVYVFNAMHEPTCPPFCFLFAYPRFSPWPI